MNKLPVILSLDISTVSTGWCVTIGTKIVDFGVLKINKNNGFAYRLYDFRTQFKSLLNSISKIDEVVIENGFALRNVSTLKALAKVAGVAMECCMAVLDKEPYIMNNKTVKKFFDVKTKEELYEVIVKKHKKICKNFEFKTHNDITDAIAQAICYHETILKG